jgi:glycerol-3-phosphate dehydrogenase
MWRGDWRDETWSKLSQQWDVIVIGGGIVGAGIGRVAAQMGLHVLLVEQRDFASGTSSRSSKFVHGGLRYIKERQFHMTWEAIHDRDHLLKDGGGLVMPIRFVITRYDGDHPGALTYRLGLTLYDLMARRRDHSSYTKEQLTMLVPHVREAGLLDGFGYSDAQTDDARLTLRVISEAVAAGASAINYVRAESLLKQGEQVTGVLLRDQIAGRQAEARARVVINASGAWADQLRAAIGLEKMIRPLRGSHLIFPSWRLPVANAVNVNHPDDGRPITIFPWEGVSVVGSSDLIYDGSLDTEPSITPAEVAYLMGAVEKAFAPLNLTLDDILATYAGVRPIVDTGQADPAHMPRDPKDAYENGLLTVAGGKLTTFRTMALDALRTIPAGVLGKPVPSDTAALDPLRVEIDVPEPQRMRLLGRYGNLADQVVAAQPGDLEPIPGTNALWLELRWAARSEAVMHLEDLLLRRVRLGLLAPRGGKDLLPQIRAICQPELGWDDARWQAEEADYLALWERCYSLPPRELIPDWHREETKP